MGAPPSDLGFCRAWERAAHPRVGSKPELGGTFPQRRVTTFRLEWYARQMRESFHLG